MSDMPPPLSDIDPHARWKFLRDVGVFQFKLFLNGVHGIFQIPLTLGAAAIDLVFKGHEEGSRFYKMVEHGRTIDDFIDIYSVIAGREKNSTRTLPSMRWWESSKPSSCASTRRAALLRPSKQRSTAPSTRFRPKPIAARNTPRASSSARRRRCVRKKRIHPPLEATRFTHCSGLRVASTTMNLAWHTLRYPLPSYGISHIRDGHGVWQSEQHFPN